MHEPSATQSVLHSAARGDRVRRVSLAHGRLARLALPVAATACLTSAAASIMGGPPGVGLLVLAAGAVAAATSAWFARRGRVVPDNIVAELDRAADLGGSLRSAHWFADARRQGAHTDRNWVTFHLEAAAAGAAGADWTGLYARPSTPLRSGLALLCVVATLALFAWPLPRLIPGRTGVAGGTAGPAPTAPPPVDLLVPQLIEGMRAMQAGRTPSQAQLSAIAQALRVAKADPVAQQKIQGQLRRSDRQPDASRAAPDSDIDSGDPLDYNNGFELADLDWAYQETMARALAEEQQHAEPGAEARAIEGAAEGKKGERTLDPSGSGAMTGVPFEADTRGQAADVTSLRLGRQQSSGGADLLLPPPPAQDRGRAATVAAALRQEVVHARSDVARPDLDPPTVRRASKPRDAEAGAMVRNQVTRYDRSRAVQPPPVPDSRRALVQRLFLRPAEAPPAKQR